MRIYELLSTGPDMLPQLVSLAKQSVAECAVLVDLLETDINVAAKVRRAKEIEDTADEIVHAVARDLTRLYRSAFDREDLHKLASSLDDVIDFSYGAADRILLYKIDRIPPAALAIAKVIQRQSEELLNAVSALQNREKAFAGCVAVKKLESEATRLIGSAIASLFENEPDAIQLIKMKELYALLAAACDRAKAAADTIETMTLKRGLA
jgi:uncharacterized protein Yka (UPF0111/DUF47 family)